MDANIEAKDLKIFTVDANTEAKDLKIFTVDALIRNLKTHEINRNQDISKNEAKKYY